MPFKKEEAQSGGRVGQEPISARRMSAFGGKADIAGTCPLLTQSGHSRLQIAALQWRRNPISLDANACRNRLIVNSLAAWSGALRLRQAG